jgi:hypothetical protein
MGLQAKSWDNLIYYLHIGLAQLRAAGSLLSLAFPGLTFFPVFTIRTYTFASFSFIVTFPIYLRQVFKQRPKEPEDNFLSK